MVEEKEEGFGCFGTIFLALFFSVLISGGINYFFGSETVDFWGVFQWTFIVVFVIGGIAKISAILSNNKLKKASVLEAEKIIEEEEADKDKS